MGKIEDRALERRKVVALEDISESLKKITETARRAPTEITTPAEPVSTTVTEPATALRPRPKPLDDDEVEPLGDEVP